MDISLRRCAGERNILPNMKPTVIALLALFLCVPVLGADKPKTALERLKDVVTLAEKGNYVAQPSIDLEDMVPISAIKKLISAVCFLCFLIPVLVSVAGTVWYVWRDKKDKK